MASCAFPILIEARPEFPRCFSLAGTGQCDRQQGDHKRLTARGKRPHHECPHHGCPPTTSANFFSRSRASITISRAVSSIPIAVLSTSTASVARTSGETLRSRSRRSRSITSSKTSASVIFSPFSWCSFQRRSARTSGEASRKIFSSALGRTTVPMSRPSITTPPPAPARCCSATSTSRTLAIVARRDAACATSAVRISLVTSSPSRNTRFFAPAASCSSVGGFSSMCVSFASATRRDSSSSGTAFLSAFSASARYMAPLSRYKYSSIAAMRRATLLFPEPAGPSMAIVSLGIFLAQPLLAVGSFGRQERHAELRHESRAQWKFAVQYHPQFCSALLTVNCWLFTSSKPHVVVAAIDKEHIAEVRDSSRRQRLDRPGGNGVHADSPLPKVVRQIANRRFQRRLGHAHYVVVRNHFLGTVVRQRDHPAASGHERRGAARYCNQGIDADVMRDAKAFARSVEKGIFQLFRRSKPHAVNQAVQHAVARLQLIEQSRDLIVFRDVAHEPRGARHLGDQVPGFELEPFVLIGNRQPPAGLVQFLGDGPRDAALVGQSEDDRCFLRLAHSGVLSCQSSVRRQKNKATLIYCFPLISPFFAPFAASGAVQMR